MHFNAGPGLAPIVEGTTIVQEFRRDPNNPDVAFPEPAAPPVVQLEQPYVNHNGGSIEFSPVDGYLHVALGDGGLGGDPFMHGQNKSTWFAALLRLDVSPADGGYLIPSGNVTDGAPEVYDWGLRNPYRFSFDLCTGDRYIGDVGQGVWEEVDIAAAGDGNKNWGWSCFEGNHDYGLGCSDPPAAHPPAVEYFHDGGQARSVIGGYVYRGTSIPWLRGRYFYADYITGEVWTLRWADGVVTEHEEVTEQLGSLGLYNWSSFGQDATGDIYLLHYAGSEGKLFRIDPG